MSKYNNEHQMGYYQTPGQKQTKKNPTPKNLLPNGIFDFDNVIFV